MLPGGIFLLRPDFLLEFSCLMGGALSMPPGAPEIVLLWSEYRELEYGEIRLTLNEP